VVLAAFIEINSDGEKKLLGIGNEISENSEQRKTVFLDLTKRSLKNPKLVLGDGALGL
jgi:transposase-like protein